MTNKKIYGGNEWIRTFYNDSLSGVKSIKIV